MKKNNSRHALLAISIFLMFCSPIFVIAQDQNTPDQNQQTTVQKETDQKTEGSTVQSTVQHSKEYTDAVNEFMFAVDMLKAYQAAADNYQIEDQRYFDQGIEHLQKSLALYPKKTTYLVMALEYLQIKNDTAEAEKLVDQGLAFEEKGESKKDRDDEMNALKNLKERINQIQKGGEIEMQPQQPQTK